MKVATILGLLRRDAIAWGDYLVEVTRPSDKKKLKWVNLRSRLSASQIRFYEAGQGPSGRRIWSLYDKEVGRTHFINSLERSALFLDGLRARGNSLARSYGLDLITFRNGDLVIDVGANYSDLLAYFDLDIKVAVDYLGIEPGMDEFECMKRNCVGKRVRLLDVALGEKDSTATFYYAPEGANSSLDKPPFEIDSEYEVSVRELCSILASPPYVDRRVRLLKVEAEGSELAVIKGTLDALAKIDYIAVDMGFEQGMNQTSPAPEIIHLLVNEGFRILTVGDPGSLRFLFQNVRAD